MFDLSRFSLSDLVRCGADMRTLGSDCSDMESAAEEVVSYLYDNLRISGGVEPGCVLVRYYVTLPLGKLEPGLRQFAQDIAGSSGLAPSTKCLTLLASRGVEDAWNSRHRSVGHKAIPLPSAEVVAQLPMVAQLVRQLGLEISTLLEPDPAMLVDLEQQNFNVFHVGEAQGSPHIPAQSDFVIPYKVRSVLGFGGMLPDGELFATILFGKVAVTRETAEMFRTIALSVKMAVLPFVSQNRYFRG